MPTNGPTSNGIIVTDVISEPTESPTYSEQTIIANSNTNQVLIYVSVAVSAVSVALLMGCCYFVYGRDKKKAIQRAPTRGPSIKLATNVSINQREPGRQATNAVNGSIYDEPKEGDLASILPEGGRVHAANIVRSVDVDAISDSDG